MFGYLRESSDGSLHSSKFLPVSRLSNRVSLFCTRVAGNFTLYLPMNQNAVEFHAYNIIGKTKQAKRKKNQI